MKNVAHTFEPKKLLSILEAYVRTLKRQAKDMEIKTPITTLLLKNGSQISGRVSACDFQIQRLSFIIITPEGSIDVCFLDFEQITAIVLHDLNLCQEFLEEIKSL